MVGSTALVPRLELQQVRRIGDGRKVGLGMDVLRRVPWICEEPSETCVYRRFSFESVAIYYCLVTI